jgi:hypothetical protein
MKPIFQATSPHERRNLRDHREEEVPDLAPRRF